MKNNINNFYYDILNIKKDTCTKLDILKVVNKELKKTIPSDGLCKVVSNNISIALKEKSIDNRIIKTNIYTNNSYEHEAVIASYKEDENIKFLLIDPTYSQFIPNNTLRKSLFTKWPSEVLQTSEEGNGLLESLIKDGYDDIDDFKLFLYLHSFDPLLQEMDSPSIYTNIFLKNMEKSK